MPKGKLWGPRAIGGRFTVHIRQPSTEEMEAIVAENVRHKPRAIGAVRSPLRLLYAPSYLPVLKRRTGDADADEILRLLPGVESIETKEATSLLTELLGSEHLAVRRQAARKLCDRLPAPAIYGKVQVRTPFRYYANEDRSEFLSRVWSEDMKPAVLAFAGRVLREILDGEPVRERKPDQRDTGEDARLGRDRLDLRDLEAACYLVESVGGKRWLSRIREVLQTYPHNCQAQRTAQSLCALGQLPPPPDENSTTGDWIVWLNAYREVGAGVRQRYPEVYRAALTHRSLQVCQIVLESIPLELRRGLPISWPPCSTTRHWASR